MLVTEKKTVELSYDDVKKAIEHYVKDILNMKIISEIEFDYDTDEDGCTINNLSAKFDVK